MRHALFTVPVLVASWAWFGLPGTVPAVIWCWHRRPQALRGEWRLPLGRARRARLGPWRTWIAFRGRSAVEIFNDELHADDLAHVRRTLRAQLAAG